MSTRPGRFARGFLSARGGNVSILFGISLIPLVGLAGLGTDYGIALSAKSKLDNAADAAALAAVATAKSFVAANQTDANLSADAIAAGLDRATRAFKVNAGSVALTQTPNPTITLTRTGQTFASTVSYTTTTTAQFGKMFGASSMTVSGSVAASADIPSYLSFYIMIDESGSMGIPTAAADQTTLANVNGGCQFACHFSDTFLANNEGATAWGWNIATTGYNKKKVGVVYVNNTKVLTTPIQLRSGAVNIALCQLLTRAKNPAVTNQYAVGVYPFVDGLGTLSPLTYDINSLQTVSDCSSNPPMALTKMLDQGETQTPVNGDPSTGTGSGGTRFDNALPSMQSLIPSGGDGTAQARPKPFVFLITDGMDNSQSFAQQSGSKYYYVGNPNTDFPLYPGSAGWIGGSKPQLPATSFCTNLKNTGATLSILYIPYVPLTVGSSNADETNAVNKLIPQISTTLQSCASSGFFYTASTQTDIANALNAMFNQAIQVTHLSK